MQGKHLAAIFTLDVLLLLPFPMNTSLRWMLPKSSGRGAIYPPFSYYLASSVNTKADLQMILSEK